MERGETREAQAQLLALAYDRRQLADGEAAGAAEQRSAVQPTADPAKLQHEEEPRMHRRRDGAS